MRGAVPRGVAAAFSHALSQLPAAPHGPLTTAPPWPFRPARRAIMADPDRDFDGLLRFCVELGGRLELEPLLRLAEALAGYAGGAGRDCLASLLG